jgi:hypothetical protein
MRVIQDGGRVVVVDEAPLFDAVPSRR